MVPQKSCVSSVLYKKYRVNWASPSAATAIHTAGDFIVITDVSLTPMEGFDVVLAAPDVVLLVDPEVEVPERSGTPPTPVELVHISFPRILASELKVISAHWKMSVSSSPREHLDRM